MSSTQASLSNPILPPTFLAPWETILGVHDKLIDAGFEDPLKLHPLIWLAGVTYITNWTVAHFSNETEHYGPPCKYIPPQIETTCLAAEAAFNREVFSVDMRSTVASFDIRAESEGREPLPTPLWFSINLAILGIPRYCPKQVREFLKEEPAHANLIRFLFGLGVVSVPPLCKWRKNRDLRKVMKEPISLFNDRNEPSNAAVKAIFADLAWTPKLLANIPQ